MGYLQASEMARLADLDTALHWHLRSNHYPPLPSELVGACKRAVRNCRNGADEKRVRLPKGFFLRYDGKPCRLVPSWLLVGAAHLESFIEE